MRSCFAFSAVFAALLLSQAGLTISRVAGFMSSTGTQTESTKMRLGRSVASSVSATPLGRLFQQHLPPAVFFLIKLIAGDVYCNFFLIKLIAGDVHFYFFWARFHEIVYASRIPPRHLEAWRLGGLED